MNYLKRFWHFLKKDTWSSWAVSLILTFAAIKFILFPLLSFVFATSLPLVVVESCSMYHDTSFGPWLEQNSLWYELNNISASQFERFPFRNGLNKGDIVIVSGRGNYSVGDVIIFDSDFTYPLIHRVVRNDKNLATKGDHNGGQLFQEVGIERNQVIGHAIARVPAIGWLKLIFFEAMKDSEQRGFCK